MEFTEAGEHRVRKRRMSCRSFGLAPCLKEPLSQRKSRLAINVGVLSLVDFEVLFQTVS